MYQRRYQTFYKKITDKIKAHPPAVKAILWTDRILAWGFALAYPIFLAIVFLSNPFDFPLAGSVLGLPALCFLCVTLLRMLLKRPRPYETIGAGIDPMFKKRGEGNSMPSRHVASAFVIATVILSYYPFAGAGAIIAAATLAFLRFLEGVHYPSDLIVGAVLGFVFGGISFLI